MLYVAKKLEKNANAQYALAPLLQNDEQRIIKSRQNNITHEEIVNCTTISKLGFSSDME